MPEMICVTIGLLSIAEMSIVNTTALHDDFCRYRGGSKGSTNPYTIQNKYFLAKDCDSSLVYLNYMW